MITTPHPNQLVQIWYRKQVAAVMPWHGFCGYVVVCGRSKPRNHLVRIGDAVDVVVPCGNLRQPRSVGVVTTQR